MGYYGGCGALADKSSCWSSGFCLATSSGDCCDTNGGAIAGIVIAVLVVVFLAVATCCCLCSSCPGFQWRQSRSGVKGPTQAAAAADVHMGTDPGLAKL